MRNSNLFYHEQLEAVKKAEKFKRQSDEVLSLVDQVIEKGGINCINCVSFKRVDDNKAKCFNKEKGNKLLKNEVAINNVVLRLLKGKLKMRTDPKCYDGDLLITERSI